MSLSATIRVLLTEDVVSDAELEVRELKRAGMRVTHLIADTEQTFTSALRDFEPDIILSDFSMPTFDGMSALALARELKPETPFIFVSGTIGEEYAIRALKNGATDYVLKTNLVRLPAAVERALADARQRQRLARLSRIRDIASAVNSALVRLREREPLFTEFCRIAVSSSLA
jgi:DNA-binding response OmpR family regulator